MSEKELKESALEEEKGTEATSQAAAESQKEAVDETASAESSAEAAEAEEAGAATEETPSAEPDWKDMYARMLADFDNYRKRVSRDREELVKFAASETVKDMLVTADNLALALGQAKDPEDPFVKGVKLAYESFLKALKLKRLDFFSFESFFFRPNHFISPLFNFVFNRLIKSLG